MVSLRLHCFFPPKVLALLTTLQPLAFRGFRRQEMAAKGRWNSVLFVPPVTGILGQRGAITRQWPQPWRSLSVSSTFPHVPTQMQTVLQQERVGKARSAVVPY